MNFLNPLLITGIVLLSFTSYGQWTQKDFKKLKNLSGKWEAKTETGFVQEKWSKKNDTLMEGATYNINRGVVILDEQIQLVYSNKEILYMARVSYQNKGLPVVFKMVSIKDGCYTFENKEHDFPQQIVYCLKGKKLETTVSGTTEKGNKSLVFHFEKKQ